jgi:hypothetical protein
MIEETIQTKSGKLIKVYDDVFSYQECANFFKFMRNSFYQTNGGDDSYYSRNQIYSNYSLIDIENLGIARSESYSKISDENKFHNREFKRSRVNFSYALEQNNVHVDGPGLTFLYYANMEWDLLWGGHTLFLNDKLDTPEFLSLYKPNRIVVFDGTIPHLIINPSGLCPVHRHSFAIQFSEEINNNTST